MFSSEFLTSLGTALDMNGIMLGFHTSDCVIAVARIKEELRIQLLANGQLKDSIQNFLEHFHCAEFDEVISADERKESEISELRGSLERANSQLNRQIRIHRVFKSRVRESTTAMKAAFAGQEEQIRDLRAERDNLRAESGKQKREIAQLHEGIERLNREHGERLNDARSQQENFLGQIRSDLERARANSAGQISQKNNEIECYADQIQKLEHQIAQWKRTAYLLKQAKREKEAEFGTLLVQFEESRAEWAEKLEKERERVRSQYEELLLSIKAKNKELRSLSAQSKELSNNADRRNRELTRRIAEVEFENQQISQQMESQKEEITRDKQLMESKTKALNLQCSLKCQSLTDELNANHEGELRKLYGFIVKSFKRFFDGRRPMGDDCVRSIVERAAVESERLWQCDCTIRRLLGLGATESTEEAVAKLLLGSNSTHEC
jgi:chromosome segregation ATPase